MNIIPGVNLNSAVRIMERRQEMFTHHTAAEHKGNIGPDFTPSGAIAPDCLDVEEEDVEERQRISVELARWFGID